MKKKILFTEALRTVSGGQKVLLQLLGKKHFPYEAHVLLPAPGPFSEQLLSLGAECHFLPMQSYTAVKKTFSDALTFPYEQLFLGYSAARLARKLGANLIYANSSRTFVWSLIAAHLSKRTLVWHIHNVLRDKKTLSLLALLAKSQRLKRIISGVTEAGAPFSDVSSKVVTVPYGVDCELFAPSSERRQRIRASLGVEEDMLIVGVIADLLPHKGQDVFLEAAKCFGAKALFVVVGEARLEDKHSQLYAEALHAQAGSNVLFLGYRKDLCDVLNALDVLVVASQQETGPLILLEALACAVPVISTAVGRAKELLPAEALFETGSSQMLVERLDYLLSDRQRLIAAGQAARSVALEKLSFRQFIDKLLSEIEEALLLSSTCG